MILEVIPTYETIDDFRKRLDSHGFHWDGSMRNRCDMTNSAFSRDIEKALRRRGLDCYVNQLVSYCCDTINIRAKYDVETALWCRGLTGYFEQINAYHCSDDYVCTMTLSYYINGKFENVALLIDLTTLGRFSEPMIQQHGDNTDLIDRIIAAIGTDIGEGVQLVKKVEPDHIPEWAAGFMIDTKDVAHLMSAGLLVLHDKDGHTAVIGNKGVFGSREKFDEFVDKCRRMRDDCNYR